MELIFKKILGLDHCVRCDSSPWIKRADALLALRLRVLGIAADGLPQVDSTDPGADLRARYHALCSDISALLSSAALSPEELTRLLQARAESAEGYDWWHVYAYAMYCLMLIIERYGQELGAAKGASSAELRFGASAERGLRAHVQEIFDGAPYHSLATFIFMGTGALSLVTSRGTYHVDGHLRWSATPRDPFAVTGESAAVRAPTAVCMREFSSLLVCGELAGYRVNEVLFALMHDVARPTLDAASLASGLDDAIACLQAVRRSYEQYNGSDFSPVVFASVLRQFTVALADNPSEHVARDLGVTLSADAKGFVDHFLFSMNQPEVDAPLLCSLASDVRHVAKDAIAGSPLRAAAEAAVRALSRQDFDRPDAVRALVALTFAAFELSPEHPERLEICVRHVIAGEHAQVPSGSVSAAHAVCDMFFGAQHLPTYWTHLWNRYAAMGAIDRASLDRLWAAQAQLPANTSGYEQACTRLAQQPELLEKLEALKREFACMTLAHKGVINRFVKMPGQRQGGIFGAKSGLISHLEQGTTGMRFEFHGLLSRLDGFRHGLLKKPAPTFAPHEGAYALRASA